MNLLMHVRYEGDKDDPDDWETTFCDDRQEVLMLFRTAITNPQVVMAEVYDMKQWEYPNYWRGQLIAFYLK